MISHQTDDRGIGVWVDGINAGVRLLHGGAMRMINTKQVVSEGTWMKSNVMQIAVTLTSHVRLRECTYKRVDLL